jgi:hypothetical protein
MSSPTTRNKRRIREAIEFLKSSRRAVEIKVDGQENPFTSKIITVDHGDVLARPGMGGTLLIETLSPETGNELIESKKSLTVSFSLGKYDCEFTSLFVRRSKISPYYGHIISYPECIRILNRRRHNRYERGTSEAPLFRDARLTMKNGEGQVKDYDFKVFDVSEQGVGILAGEDMQEFLQAVEIGHKIEDLELLAAWMTIKVSGTVKHKSKINDGKYSGHYLVGIQLDERLEHYV